MARPKGIVVCSLTLAFYATALQAQDATPTHCSIATLKGTMVYASISQNAQNGVKWSLSGQETYDGKGHMKYHELLSYGTDAESYTGTGTYTIGVNCIATVLYDVGSAPWTYFVSADGSHYYWNDNQDDGVISAGRADRVSTALLLP